jgi:hypothetical protein
MVGPHSVQLMRSIVECFTHSGWLKVFISFTRSDLLRWFSHAYHRTEKATVQLGGRLPQIRPPVIDGIPVAYPIAVHSSFLFI